MLLDCLPAPGLALPTSHNPMATTQRLLLLAIWCLLAASRANAQDVISVGGFVQVSPKLSAGVDQQIDLSAVRVQLFSPTGVKKSEGDCSPNGYYFVPVDAGTYKVRVHALPGWVFSPQEVDITCDQQQCNAGEDVNFDLSGIELSGRVEPGPSPSSCKAAAAGPFSGISITVKPADSNAKAATAQVTDSSFSTGPLLPGKYVITASHPEWQLQPAQITHTLGLDSAQLPSPFRISGYKLSGRVTSKSGPVSGIQVTLLSTELDSAGCSKTHPPGSVSAADIETALSTTALCSVLTGTDGQYSFPGVPCGQYTLQAQHPDTDSTFEIEPASKAVVVGHGNAVVPEPFTVTGFSVQGRVVDGAGNGVAGVAIIVAGEERAATDLNGRYTMARMNEGRLDVVASKKHYTFSSLTAVQVTPAAQVLPDIQVKSVAVCGRLVYGEPRFKVSSRRVSLTSSDGGSLAEQVSVDASGGFCFMVPAGRYRIAPYVTADERSKGLLFSPSHSDLAVEGQPVFEVVFSQVQLSVSGSVVCLDGPCPGDVHLSLQNAAGKVAYSAQLDEVAVQDSQSTGNSITFQLPRVSPGRYSLTASKGGWCWDAAEGVEVVVEAADVEAAALKQSGYLLQVSSSHAADLTISGAAAATPLEVHVAEGQSSVCIPGSGSFSIAPRSCYIFSGDSLSISIKPSSPPEPLALRATQVYVSGKVVVSAADDVTLPDDITITAALSGAETTKGVITKATASDPGAPNVFTYTLAVDLGSTIVVTPSVTDNSGLLFYPGSQIFKHDATAKTCPPSVEVLEAKPGVLVTGVTEPAVEGAEVRVLFKGASAAAGRAVGDLAAEGITGASGAFSIGPLYDDASYEVELSKLGHTFTATGETNGQRTFATKQLAQVAVTVDLPAGAGADPSAVFLSLSGSGGFKNNARLGPDSSLTFFDLQPGTYYLKPLLREHQFDPPVADLVLEDGQAVDVTLTAVRTAWGISGVVKSVGGSPLAGAAVEVCQGSGAAAVVLDSSVTDEAGEYRIGNLKPDSVYEARVRLDGRVISAHPAGKKVNMGRADVSGIDFVAFRTSSRSALSAALRLPPQLRTAIKAQLLPAGPAGGAPAPGVPAASVAAVDGSGFFEMRGLKPGGYVLRLSCDPAAAGGLSCEPWEMSVQVPTKDLHLGVLPYQPTTASSSSGSASTASMQVSDEGLDWKVPVLVLVLLIAGSATVLKPAIVDILQLKPVIAAPPVNTGSSGYASGGGAAAAAAQGSSGGGGSKAATDAASRAAAVVAAAAAPLPTSGNGSAAAASDWLEDSEMRSMGMKQRGSAGGRSGRARRA